MTELADQIYEPYTIDLKELFTSGEPLTFLVGAGISIESPSNLSSAWQFMKALIRFGAVEEESTKILGIENLRFEYLIERFRDIYDNELRIMEYFELSTYPNLIHQFLAQMIKANHYVLTTNFDTLIERAVGLDNPALRVIITRDDFEKYEDPQKNIQDGFLPVYKLHGSLRNPKTGENTRESVITTLDALGKHKEGEILSVETHKRKLLENACKDRILVVMGYSGGDDLDIVPFILHMAGIKKVIWISHTQEINKEILACRYLPRMGISADTLQKMTGEDKILQDIRTLRLVETIKVSAHTASLIARIMGTSYTISRPEKIVENVFKEIDNLEFDWEDTELLLSLANRFITMKPSTGLNLAKIVNQLLNNSPQKGDRGSGFILLGNAYHKVSNLDKAAEAYQTAANAFEAEKDWNGARVSFSRLGSVQMEQGKHDDAIANITKCVKIAENQENTQSIMRERYNLSLALYKAGRFEDSFQECKNVVEFVQKYNAPPELKSRLADLLLFISSVISEEIPREIFEILK